MHSVSDAHPSWAESDSHHDFQRKLNDSVNVHFTQIYTLSKVEVQWDNVKMLLCMHSSE